VTHAAYVFGGYAATAAALGAYAAWILSRRRALARQLAASPRGTDGTR
jgi:heme exporter protein CcmD